MNLHQIVFGAIGSVNRQRNIKVFNCVGQTNVKGKLTAKYRVWETMAQIQQPSASDLELNERVAKSKHSIKVWMPPPIGTINRGDQKSEDMIQTDDGKYWLVVGVRESYHIEGWISVLCVEQLKPPEIVIEEEGDGE
jgi:hypothetical protein